MHATEINFFLFFWYCSQLQPCPGEVIIDFLAHVEDTKGNNGDKGNLFTGGLGMQYVQIISPVAIYFSVVMR